MCEISHILRFGEEKGQRAHALCSQALLGCCLLLLDDVW